MAKTITIDIDQTTQEVDIDLAGFQGSGCHEISSALAAAIGEVKTTKKKPEWREKACNVVSKS